MVSPKRNKKRPGKNGFTYRRQFGVIVICNDEPDQAKTFNTLKRAGRNCKVVTV